MLFAAHHLSLTAALPLAALGATWSYLYLASGNLLVPVAIHALWNARVFGTPCWVAVACVRLLSTSSFFPRGLGRRRRQRQPVDVRRRPKSGGGIWGGDKPPGAPGAHWRPRASRRRRCSVATFRRRRPPPPAGPAAAGAALYLLGRFRPGRLGRRFPFGKRVEAALGRRRVW